MSYKNLKILVLLSFFSTIFAYEFGNVKNYKFIDGLSSNNITEIKVDNKNRTWVGTYNGISMFNGSQFQNFYNDDSITEKFINCIAIDKQRVWFGTNDGLLEIIEKEEEITVKKYLEFPNGVASIAVVGNRLYVVSKNKMYSINSNSKTIKEIDFPNIKKVVSFNKQLLITTNSKIFSYDLSSGNKEILKNIDADINSVKLKDSKLFIGTDNGLYRYIVSDSNLRLEKHFFKGKSIQAFGFTKYEVFVSSENEIYKINGNYSEQVNLKFDKVRSIHSTNEDILFIGSFGDGLFQIDPYSFINYTVLAGKKNLRINSSVELDGNLFFATEEGLYSQNNDKFILKGKIFDLNVEENMIIWIATQKGVYTYSRDELKKIKLDGVQNNITVLSIEVDKMGVKWFGTTKGLIKYDDRKKQKTVFLYNTADGLISNVIYDICKVSGGIVVASSNGITYFKNYKKIIPYQLTLDVYNSVVYDFENSVLWASTAQSGVKKVDLENGKIIDSYSTSNGLNNNEILKLTIDTNSTLWVSTDGGGVSVFNGEIWGSLDSRDGLVSNTVYDVNQINGEKFCISTKSGYSIYNPKITQTNLSINQLIGAVGSESIYSTQIGGKVFFDLSVIDYITNQQKYIFRYKLDDDWNYNNGKSNFEISGMKSGTYDILLEFIDRDLNISKQKEVKLKVLKPWYLRSKIAIPLYGGTLILFIITIFSVLQFLKKRKESEALKEADIKRQYEEMEEARKFQMGMLPDETPDVLNLDIATHINTADEVGGDYYDFFMQKQSNSLIVAIGDATGHGMIAGNIVSITKAGLNSVNFQSPINEILENLNKIIKKVGIGRNRMCLNICHVTDRSFEICSAGMPPTYLYKSKSKSIEEVMISGLPAGSLKNSKYSSEKFDFNTDDILVMITDGLPECENANGEYIGYERIKKIILENHSMSAGEIKNHLADLGKSWMAGSPITDDITFVVIKKC